MKRLASVVIATAVILLLALSCDPQGLVVDDPTDQPAYEPTVAEAEEAAFIAMMSVHNAATSWDGRDEAPVGTEHVFQIDVDEFEYGLGEVGNSIDTSLVTGTVHISVVAEATEEYVLAMSYISSLGNPLEATGKMTFLTMIEETSVDSFTVNGYDRTATMIATIGE